MCRLAYVPPAAASAINLRLWFLQLEASCGGHGNGVAIASKCRKGVALTTEMCATFIETHKLPALFHTRRASAGGKTGQLCHPFACRGGWLCHNGHWYGGAQIAQALDDTGRTDTLWSDTRVGSALVDKLGFYQAMTKYNPPGVWLWLAPRGKVKVWKSGGELWYCQSLKAYGSEPPHESAYTWRPVADGYYSGKREPSYDAPKDDGVESWWRGVGAKIWPRQQSVVPQPQQQLPQQQLPQPQLRIPLSMAEGIKCYRGMRFGVDDGFWAQ